MTIDRRALLAGGLALPVAAPFVWTARAAEPVTVRMGSLKLIHSITPWFYQRFAPPGMTIEIVNFESPTDGKNAVVTKSVDFAAFGIAAGILGAAAREPVVVIGSACDKGMAIVAKKDSDIASLKDLKGKKVAIWPGSTQEVFVLERLRMEGMSIKDVTPVRVSFNEMHAALAHGDVDAYVGAEPGPGLSLSTGVGKIVEYPYSTPMGGLNMILATHRDTAAQKPDLARTMVGLQRKGSEYATAHPDEVVAMAVQKLGMKKEAVAASLDNVALNWEMTPAMIAHAKTYTEQMLAMKQIRALPDFDTFIDKRFSDEVARGA